MDEEAADLQPGPLVLMLASGLGYVVIVDPCLPSGNHRREFYAKSDGWRYAQELWSKFKLGFADHSTGNAARAGTLRTADN